MRTVAPSLLALSLIVKFFYSGQLLINDAYLFNFIVVFACISTLYLKTPGSAALAVALALWATGSIISTYANLIDNRALAFWSNFFYLAFYPALFVSLTLRTQSRLRINDLLDSLIIGLGLSAMGSALVIQPLLNHLFEPTRTPTLANTIYPVADVTMLALFLARTYHESLDTNKYRLLMGAGVLVFALTDALYLAQQYIYTSNGWLDYGWPIGLLLMSESFHHQRAGGEAGSWQETRRKESRPITPIVLVILSSLALLLAAALLPSTFPRIVIWPSAATIIAALARLALAVADARLLAAEESLARTDELTGLANRRRFVSALDEIASVKAVTEAKGEVVGLFIIDLDGFKEVNDSFGHSVGDELLREIAHRLRNALPHDALLARLGGDEFGVVVAADPKVVRWMGSALHSTCEVSVELPIGKIKVGASVGLTMCTRAEFLPSTALRRADLAMYRAKAERCGFIEWREEFDTSTGHENLLIQDLLTSRQNFTLEFQSIVDLENRELVGMEALLRWKHPRVGVLYPKDFLPAVERLGLEYTLSIEVISMALTSFRSWMSLRGSTVLHVNISSRVIQDIRFASQLAMTLEIFEVPPSSIVLEITENQLLDDPDSVQKINDLRKMGIQISIDDFGIGYSSLSYFQRFEFDEIKLDRTFIHALTEDFQATRAREVIRSALELSGRLGIRVVAEGIESEEQLLILKGLGCAHGQGFFFDRPTPAEQFGLLFSRPYP